jgi:predicted nucleotidyltransferase
MRPSRPPTSLPIFRSALQAELLTRLYLEPDRAYALRELVRASDGSRATVDRELGLLTEAGLVNVEKVGRTRLFSARVDSPLFSPLKELIDKTLGVEPRLRSALDQVPGLEAAAVFGSWSSGQASPSSDIDVLVVGNVQHDHVIGQIHDVGEATGREVNALTFTRAEAVDRLRDRDGFLARVLRSDLIDLVGDVRSLILGNVGP